MAAPPTRRHAPPALLGLICLLLGACSGDSKRPFDAAAECPRILADNSLPTSAEEATAQREAGRSWSDREARVVYVCRVWGIAADEARRAEGLSVEARARRAFETRHAARLTSRAMMESRAEVAALRARDKGLPRNKSSDRERRCACAEPVRPQAATKAYQGVRR